MAIIGSTNFPIKQSVAAVQSLETKLLCRQTLWKHVEWSLSSCLGESSTNSL